MKRRVHAHEKTGELNIVPYLDIMVNLTMFMLVSMTSVIQLAIINVNVPSYGGPAAGVQQEQKSDKPPLLLSVAISPKGFYIAGSGGVLGADTPPVNAQSEKTLPPTIPLLPDGKYDYTQLKRKMVDVKDKYPDESKVILTADPTVVYDVVVQTMDAVREDGPKKLFYDVVLGAM